MERLKAALERAREVRGEAPGTAANHPSPAARLRGTAPAGQSTDAAWQALMPVDIPTERLRRKRLVAFAQSDETSAFDVLRTKVLQLTGANGWRRIAITSPL